MTDWGMYTNKDIIDRDNALELLSSTFLDLNKQWILYKQTEYKDYQSERLDYIDIGIMIDYIVSKVKVGQTDGLDEFFNRVELILAKADDYTQNLIVIGLLEGIQNVSGWDNIDYHKGYDKWLRPATKKYWDDIIYFWESDESRKRWEELKNNKKNNGC